MNLSRQKIDLADIKRQIDELDLTPIANNMVVKQGWLRSEVDDACRLYRNFLYLQCKYPEETIVPSEDVDEVWHNHILDTNKYQKDCQNLFGEFLHHYPYFGIDGKSTLIDLSNAFDTTQKLHFAEFGSFIEGVRYTKLSRLFRRLFK